MESFRAPVAEAIGRPPRHCRRWRAWDHRSSLHTASSAAAVFRDNIRAATSPHCEPCQDSQGAPRGGVDPPNRPSPGLREEWARAGFLFANGDRWCEPEASGRDGFWFPTAAVPRSTASSRFGPMLAERFPCRYRHSLAWPIGFGPTRAEGQCSLSRLFRVEVAGEVVGHARPQAWQVHPKIDLHRGARRRLLGLPKKTQQATEI